MTAIGMTIIVLLAIFTAVISVAVIGASVLVTVAVRREERLGSLTGGAPGRAAWLARTLLAAPAPRMADDLRPGRRPVARAAWYQRGTGSAVRQLRPDV
jgi:hypothetical protein